MVTAILAPSGDQRGDEQRAPAKRCSNVWALPSSPTVQIEELPSSFQRVNAIWRPSGDQSPERAPSTILEGSPPMDGTRKRARLAPTARVNRIALPSREKRGESSKPAVKGASQPE